jgi:ATP-dependent DNA helicase RecG
MPNTPDALPPAGRFQFRSLTLDQYLLRASGLDGRTTLQRVQPHRLRALILEDLERYPGSSSAEVHQRVGPEIPVRAFKSALHELVNDRQITYEGERYWRRYRVAASIERGDFDVR